MNSIIDIENAVKNLSHKEFSEFKEWFSDYDQKKWDDQLNNDIINGNLNSLFNETLNEYNNGKCSKL